MLWKNKEWKCRQVCIPGKGGTLKPYQEYGDDLVCVRYRYDDNGFRIKTVELVIDVAKIK